MKLEFYEGTNPSNAKLAKFFFQSKTPGKKLKFVTIRNEETGEIETQVFLGDEHAGVLADKLCLPTSVDEAAKAKVRAQLVTAGIIEDGEVKLGSESIDRLFGISESEQAVLDGAEFVRSELAAILSA